MDCWRADVVSKLRYFVKDALKSDKIKFYAFQNCEHVTSTARGHDGDLTNITQTYNRKQLSVFMHLPGLTLTVLRMSSMKSMNQTSMVY